MALVPYEDFSLETISTALGVSVETADVFPALPPFPVPQWLREMLDRGRRQVLLSEKARSEFIVVPVLLACQEFGGEPISIYSGQRLDVDPGRGLIGECDFILAATAPVPALRSPLMIIVEAKKNDVESGVWQCIAQMVDARIFNERTGRAPHRSMGASPTAKPGSSCDWSVRSPRSMYGGTTSTTSVASFRCSAGS